VLVNYKKDIKKSKPLPAGRVIWLK